MLRTDWRRPSGWVPSAGRPQPRFRTMNPRSALTGSGGAHDPALKEAIQAIRRLVSEHFYLCEMRDPELTVRTNRRAYALPRQIAMYIARQLTGASLQEIGREFGGRHHTTVLHAINKIEGMRHSDEALNRRSHNW